LLEIVLEYGKLPLEEAEQLEEPNTAFVRMMSKHLRARAADLYSQRDRVARALVRERAARGGRTFKAQVWKNFVALPKHTQQHWEQEVAIFRPAERRQSNGRWARGEFDDNLPAAHLVQEPVVTTPKKQSQRQQLLALAGIGEAFIESVQHFTSPAKNLAKHSFGNHFQTRRIVTDVVKRAGKLSGRISAKIAPLVIKRGKADDALCGKRVYDQTIIDDLRPYTEPSRDWSRRCKKPFLWLTASAKVDWYKGTFHTNFSRSQFYARTGISRGTIGIGKAIHWQRQ
jgi:hypothetical protein